MTVPLVSVLMTAYNREEYIAEAIESVLASTFKDFELVIVDDCSSDNTVEIARRYTSDPRVQLYLNEKNLGDYPNRNRAASLGRGKYLKYVDADDLIYPHGLVLMVETMERFPDVALGLSMPQDARRPYPYQLSPKEAYCSHFLNGHHVFSKSPLTTIIRSDVLRTLGGFVADEGPRGDYATWLLIAARYPIVLMPDGIVWWRAHPKQESRYREKSKAEDISRQYLLTRAALDGECCPLPWAEQAAALCRLERGHVRSILRLALSGSPAVAWDVFRSSGLSPSSLARAFQGV